uniref:Uncharacterized protein n=1 Tax=Oryza glaberrima TaxID=4538 RepID=I1PQ92_ORYGL
MTRILQLQRSICITPEQWTGEGVSFIYGVWKRGRSRINCYLKKWNGSDYPLASALTLLTTPTLCLLRFLIHVLMSISICMILILQSIYPLVLPIELLSMFFPFREMVAVPNAELAAVPNDQCLWGLPSLQLSPVSPMCWALNTFQDPVLVGRRFFTFVKVVLRWNQTTLLGFRIQRAKLKRISSPLL